MRHGPQEQSSRRISHFQLDLQVYGLGLPGLSVQGMKTRTPKVVPPKVPLSILLIRPFSSLRDP